MGKIVSAAESLGLRVPLRPGLLHEEPSGGGHALSNGEAASCNLSSIM
jgi:hypothetical protein